MAAKPEQINGCRFGARYFSTGSWKRHREDAKRALKRKRRRIEKSGEEEVPTRITKGWAD